MSAIKYVEVSKGIKIGVPMNFSQKEIDAKVAKFKENLEKSNEQHYNPHKKKFLKSKF